MGKRRGEDAGIDMQVQKESYDVDGGDGAADSYGTSGTGESRADSSILQARSFRRAKRRSNAPFASSSGSSGGGGLFAGVNLTAALPTPPAKPAATPATNGSSTSDQNGFWGLSSGSGSANSSASDEHLKRMAALNKSFCKWVDREMDKTETKPLVDGVLEYIRYAAAEKKRENANCGSTAGAGLGSSSSSSSSTSMNGSSSKSGGGLFSATPPPSTSAKASTSSTSSADSGGSSSTTTTAPSGGSLFSSAPSSGGLFGSSSTSTGAMKPFDFSGGVKSGSTSLFGSSSSSSSSSSSTSSMTPGGGGLFGSSGASAPGAGTTEGGAGDDDGGDTAAQEGETKVEDSIRDDETQIVKTRAKIFYLKEGSWISKGLGHLSLLQEKESKRAYVVLRSDAGRITANIPLLKGMHTSVEEKAKSVRFAAVSYSEDGDGNPVAENDGKIVPFMVRVKTAQEANDLKAKIDSCLEQVP
ncbi:Nuclear pore complex protein Nup50 [Hondaea fermentalgiana]|uniref:Nuclear pore complex protein Nup50 n=1 Tax=Hondaea fermentalgiana TaxID=2315210 RepID=A0A2R5GAJ1_9STRA|nr:Nuclear pore complex protein Nup50 [Hondaea fermentalgiana]|eukprot:GBG27309.1 Nuclear pore complex protein Nup50 [Hondaea fermentalgiana]